MVNPTAAELSTEILETLEIENIIYAEYASPGAMGNEGGVMIYVIKNNNFNCYETDIHTNKNMFYKAIDILEGNKDDIFEMYDGGFGNVVFINKNVSLKILINHFIYSRNNTEFGIYSSTEGVFKQLVHYFKETIEPEAGSGKVSPSNFVNFTGYTKHTYDNGDTYEGNISYGIPDGKGKIIWNSGDVYEGNLVNSEYNGKGLYTFSNGSVYEGDFVKGIKHGTGKWTDTTDGEIFTGEFKNDMRNGNGKSTMPDDTVKEGYWKDDKFTG